MIAVAYLVMLATVAGVALFLSAVDPNFGEVPPRQDKSRIPFVAWVPDK